MSASARVRLSLSIDGVAYALSQVGPNGVLIRPTCGEAWSLPPGSRGELIVAVDRCLHRQEIILPSGATPGVFAEYKATNPRTETKMGSTYLWKKRVGQIIDVSTGDSGTVDQLESLLVELRETQRHVEFLESEIRQYKAFHQEIKQQMAQLAEATAGDT